MSLDEESTSIISSTSNESTPSNCKSNTFLCGVVEGFYGRPWTLEQRKDLFAKLKRFGMNVYMYAPKDDLKHRNLWRELYTVEESEQLSVLISNSKSNGILFVYAISPGLDIGYSNPKDVQALKRKLDQVKQLGCESFALLFDDIEPELNENDREAFKSFASAQVSVTNEVYQHLDQPVFIFCPTEYCSSRAVPNVQHSDYLSTIGAKLNTNIGIMWTGNRVISQSIGLSQIQELTDVLRRKPVIWDNLHANDYDQKRLFLGPYSDRSTQLIPHLSGVFTNPNCEYEANFIPIHTLGQWSKCTKDANECQSNSDIKLESESENGSIEDVPVEMDSCVYHYRNALRVAIQEWITEFYKVKNPQIKPNLVLGTSTTGNPPPNITLNYDSLITTTTKSTSPCKNEPLTENGLMLDSDIGNRIENGNSTINHDELLENKENTVQSLEPMDCNPSPDSSHKINSLDVPMIENLIKESDGNSAKNSMNSVDSDEMQTEVTFENDDSAVNETKSTMLTFEDIALLVDLFYLPFEHGPQGVQILHEFHWLKTNGFIVSEYRRKRQTANTNEQTNVSAEINEWYDRAAKFNEMTMLIGRLLTRLTFCKNRSLLYELYPYVWDIKGVISLLNSYVKWIGFSKGYKEAFQSGEQEPWLFRGGLTGELQRMLPVESVSDLFLYKAPDSPTSRIYTIRPYLPSDLQSVYEICFKNYDRHILLENNDQLVGDKLIGGFLTLSPEYCFIVEDDVRLCGYALAVLDAKNFFAKLEVSWIPGLLEKYPLMAEERSLKEKYVGQFVDEMHNQYKQQLSDPEEIFANYPSLLTLAVMANIMDLSVPKRMLTCVIAALKANGSKGLYCRIPANDKKTIEFYLKLGFQTINIRNSIATDDVYVGRVI
ncbi:O-GlcNAcase isoform X2 [Dermatophagoides pteronyssinus]|uniref:protein O-GlcNAcase n=1 Tax=Dermatophagoides pteronyssinus TaxID=6956 RepID=A0A6P6XLI4_DERPT|nr:protein O-GlcNAcase-like isoform X2 [Dermatophagoides pteronyssinus]